jgi:hypothetical protein
MAKTIAIHAHFAPLTCACEIFGGSNSESSASRCSFFDFLSDFFIHLFDVKHVIIPFLLPIDRRQRGDDYQNQSRDQESECK